ncbi:MAG: hypothetical protein LBP37_03275 [Spirochaetaceae bacterium]|jgi:hypothetical protein|nr:hypothetical protein [Spirochaetaceae bacterium]
MRNGPSKGFSSIKLSKLSKSRFLCFVSVFLCAGLFHTLSAGESDGANASGVYQTPPVLYVGDRGSLVYTLDVFTPIPETYPVFEDGFPKTDDILIHKIDIDRRARRVIIEFQAFRTGTVELPPIPFGGAELKGLQVNIASILDSEKGVLTLSPAAGLLAAPGTFWIITAFFTFVVIVLIVMALLYAKGGALFANMRSTLRTRLLLHWINTRLGRVERRLRLGRLSEKEALTELSNRIRVFLSRFWTLPCYAMSAEEFLYFSIPGAADKAGLNADLCAFFKKCDEFRFGGGGQTKNTVSMETVRSICAEAKILVNDKVTAIR